MNFQVIISLYKTGSQLDGPYSSPDSKLESGEKQRQFILLIS
jgi:hypothetical protein